MPIDSLLDQRTGVDRALPNAGLNSKSGVGIVVFLAATAFLSSCFRPAPPLEEGDDRNSELSGEVAPDDQTSTSGHPLIRKRQVSKSSVEATPNAGPTSTAPTSGTSQPDSSTASGGTSAGTGSPAGTTSGTQSVLSLFATTVGGLRPAIWGRCDPNGSHAASSSAGKVQFVGCTGLGELLAILHLPAGSGSFNLTVESTHSDGTKETVTQTIQRTAFLCPVGYVGVPGSGVPGLGNVNASTGNAQWWLDVDRDFCVMKYPAKDNNGSTYATSTAEGTPWVNIKRGTDESSPGSALKACADAGTGYRLISNTQWQTLARNAESVAANWSGGVVGSGSMARGHSDNAPGSILENSISDADGYFGTGNIATMAYGSGGEQRRTQTLSNGEVVWDIGGNIWQFVSDHYTELGVHSEISGGWFQFTNSTYFNQGGVNRLLFAPAGLYDSAQNVGQLYGRAAGSVMRGGPKSEGGSRQGLFATSLAYGVTNSSSEFGFRCSFIQH